MSGSDELWRSDYVRWMEMQTEKSGNGGVQLVTYELRPRLAQG